MTGRNAGSMLGRTGILLLAGVAALGALAGCGPGNLTPITATGQPVEPTSVLFVSAPPASLAVNASAGIYAAAVYPLDTAAGSENAAVTYSLSCGSPNACGTFGPNDEVGAVTYTAPAAIPSGGTVTVTATSVADTSISASTKITIVPPIPISVSFYGGMPASMQVGSAISMRAQIENDVTANPQVKWAVSCGGTACGGFNTTTTTNEAPTTYTAPAAIPPGGTVTVTATSVTDATKSVSATIAITAQTPTLANGTYVFQLSGPAGSSANFVTGVFVAQNGTITGGEQDSIGYTTDDNGDFYPYSYLNGPITGGTYATTSDGNLQITIISTVGGGETLNGVLATGAQGFVAQLYGSPGTGTLELQTSTAAPSGGYAVSMYGGDQFGEAAWMGGILNVDSAGGISGNGSVVDAVDEGAGTPYNGEEMLAASTVAAPDKYGRVQFALNPGSSSALPATSLIGYVVDASHIRLISTVYNSVANYQGAMGGLALGQGTSTGHFSSSSLAGSSYVFGGDNGFQYGAFQVAGVLTANAGGAVTGTLNWNDLSRKGSQSPLSVTGSWTVDPTGRVTLPNLTDGSTFDSSMHLYLTGDGNALLLSSGGSQVFAGQAFEQQAGPFAASSLSGTYGLNASVANSSSNTGTGVVLGSVTAVAGSGTDSLAGYADGGNGGADFAVTGSFTPGANGVFTGTLTGMDAASRTTAGSFTLYMVDGTQGIAIETDDTQLTLGRLMLVQ